MRNELRPRFWLCLPPLLLFSCDVAFTLIGQSADYYNGDLDAVREANLLAYWLLLLSPWLFLAVAVGWAFLFCTLLLVARQTLAVLLSFVLTVGHALGAASWLVQLGIPGWIAALGLLIGAERLWSLSWVRQISLKLTERGGPSNE